MPSTKQIRLQNSSQMKDRVKDLLGKKINIVLRDNTVMFGELVQIDNEKLVLKNMRLKKMEYLFANITEIYFDVIV